MAAKIISSLVIFILFMGIWVVSISMAATFKLNSGQTWVLVETLFTSGIFWLVLTVFVIRHFWDEPKK